jgi:hypothetical protein
VRAIGSNFGQSLRSGFSGRIARHNPTQRLCEQALNPFSLSTPPSHAHSCVIIVRVSSVLVRVSMVLGPLKVVMVCDTSPSRGSALERMEEDGGALRVKLSVLRRGTTPPRAHTPRWNSNACHDAVYVCVSRCGCSVSLHPAIAPPSRAPHRPPRLGVCKCRRTNTR